MDKIVFEDLPSKNTPLNAEILNKLQENIENAIINNKDIKELVGTSSSPIDLNDITDVGIYKVGGAFYTNAYYVYNPKPPFILFVTGSPTSTLVQAIITGNGLAIRTRMYTANGYTWSDWEIKSGTSEGIGGDTLPIGTILPYGSDTIPDNYFLCKGQELPRAEFRELFNIIGTTYGEGDGITTFVLPNLCGKVPVGKDSEDTDFDTLGKTGGEKTHKLTASEMATLTYDFTTSSPKGDTTNGDYLGYGTYDDVKKRYYSNISTNAGDQPHNNLQPYIVTNYIIKAKMGASLIGQVIDSLDSSSTTDAPSIRVVNSIVETGTTDNGTYVKYANGELECRNSITQSVECNMAVGGMYRSITVQFPDFPIEFIDIPSVTFNVDVTTDVDSIVFASRYGTLPASKTNPNKPTVICGTNATFDATISYIAKGKWK